MDEVFGLLKEQFQQHQVSLARASKREQLDPGNGESNGRAGLEPMLNLKTTAHVHPHIHLIECLTI